MGYEGRVSALRGVAGFAEQVVRRARRVAPDRESLATTISYGGGTGSIHTELISVGDSECTAPIHTAMIRHTIHLRSSIVE